MSFSSPQAPSAARLPTALQAAAGACPHATFLASLILALLLRLLGRTEPAWIMAPTPETDRAIYAPAIGRAPHAAVIEAGLVPDWILPGIRNRGMRPAANSPPPRRITRPARAPPGAHPIRFRNNPPTRGRRLTSASPFYLRGTQPLQYRASNITYNKRTGA